MKEESSSTASRGHAENDFSRRRQVALERCQSQIKWYQDHRNRARVLYRVVQMSVIVLSALTPVLILLSDAPKVVQAVPAALAAIGAAASGFFQWRENWMRNAWYAEALKSERVKFETRTTAGYQASLDDEQALDNFVNCIETLSMNEVQEWRTQSSQIKEEDGQTESESKPARH